MMQILCDFPCCTFPLLPVIILGLFTRAAITVTVVASPRADVQLPARSFSIECIVNQESTNRPYLLFWGRMSYGNITLVIRRFRDGTVISGQRYKGRAHLKDGCTLELDNPTVEDSGKYTIEVVVPGDQKEEDRQTVDVLVTPVKSVTLVSQRTSSKTEKIRNVTENPPSETISQQHQYVTVAGWQIVVTLGSVMSVLLTMLIILTILVIRNKRIALRKYRDDVRSTDSPILDTLLEADSGTEKSKRSSSQRDSRGKKMRSTCTRDKEKLSDDIHTEI